MNKAKSSIISMILIYMILIPSISFAKVDSYYYDNYASRWGMPMTYYFKLSADDSTVWDPTKEVYVLSLVSDRGFGFQSDDISFYIPDTYLKVGDSWEFDGTKFILEAITSMKVLGINLDVAIIETDSDDDIFYRFIFSNERGLVGFSITNDKKRSCELYLLRGEHGIGYPFSLKLSTTKD